VDNNDSSNAVPTFLGSFSLVVRRAQDQLKREESGDEDPCQPFDSSLVDFHAMMREMRADLKLNISVDMDACTCGRYDSNTPQRLVFIIAYQYPKRSARGNPESLSNSTLYRAVVTPIFDGFMVEVTYMYGREPETEAQDKRTEYADLLTSYLGRSYETPTTFHERVKYRRRMRYVREVEDGVHNDAE